MDSKNAKQAAQKQVRHDPLDICEQIAEASDWPCNRVDEKTLSVEVPGKWCDLEISFVWDPELAVLQFMCAYRLNTEQAKTSDLHSLIGLLNEWLLVGHFGFCQEGEGEIIFQHSLLTRGTPGPTVEQIEDLVEAGRDACNRCFPAFEFCIVGETPSDMVLRTLYGEVGTA